MKDKEMQEHLIKILNRFSMRTDLVNELFIDVDEYTFRGDVSEDDMWSYYISVCKELKISNRVMRSPGIDSEAGKKMKIEGHLNEDLVKNELLTNIENNNFKDILGENETIVDIICDGIKSKKVESIIDNQKTTPKCDLKIITDSREINISLKKSDSGQAHLNTVNQFIKGYEKRYPKIPGTVKTSLLFLFSGHQDTLTILNDPKYFNESTNKMELRHKTLTVDTMNRYNKKLSTNLLSWVKENIGNITEIVFKKGWCRNESDWGEYIYYRNVVNENNHVDVLYSIDRLIENVQLHTDEIKFGAEGTTILLPFGSVQYHLGGLQFHHNRKKINKLLE